jgi:hypothetical protein
MSVLAVPATSAGEETIPATIKVCNLTAASDCYVIQGSVCVGEFKVLTQQQPMGFLLKS